MIKLEELSASELGFLVNEGKIKPKEVVKYFEERILKRNESINAYVYTKFEEAYEVAFKQEKLLKEGKKLGPFAGVPYALKDFLPNKIGWTNSHGGVKCLVALDEFNSAFNEAMEKAGGIPLGKTNAPSYGFRGTTDNKMYGPTSTPFNLKYNAGGSSGGSAAAVADGLALIAEGGDAGGSIRIPASYCNLYGFKAGIGTIPNIVRPDGFGTTHPYCFNGGLTKTVLDAAILLNYMKGYNPFDPFSNNNDIDYVKEMNKDISKMKIAYTTDFGIFEVEESLKNQFLKALDNFKKLDVTIEEVKFNFKHSAMDMANAWCYGTTAVLSFRDTNDKLLMTSDILGNNGASLTQDSKSFQYEVKLDIKDTAKFYEVTKKISQRTNGNNMIVIWLDYNEELDSYENEKLTCGKDSNMKCISAASVKEGLDGGSVVIQGNFTKEEAQTLVDLINSGSLPTKLSEEATPKSVSPSFGAETITKTGIAGIITFI